MVPSKAAACTTPEHVSRQAQRHRSSAAERPRKQQHHVHHVHHVHPLEVVRLDVDLVHGAAPPAGVLDHDVLHGLEPLLQLGGHGLLRIRDGGYGVLPPQLLMRTAEPLQACQHRAVVAGWMQWLGRGED